MDSDICKALINVVIAAFPAIGTLLLIGEAQKRIKLNSIEICAAYLIYAGFVFYAAWMDSQIPSVTPISWIIILLLGIVGVVAERLKFKVRVKK
jgi:undecaprenyl pyrophosphate phosphatase UppP